jgi:hypothetical protein
MKPNAILQVLQGLQRSGELARGALPNVRTLERIAARVRQDGQEGQPEEEVKLAPEDVRAALSAVAEVMADGQMHWPSPAIRVEMARLVRMAPGLSPMSLWRLALYCVGRRSQAGGPEEVEAWLAFRPWESVERYSDYVRAATTRRVPTFRWFDPVQYPTNKAEAREGFFDPLLARFIDWALLPTRANEMQSEEQKENHVGQES